MGMNLQKLAHFIWELRFLSMAAQTAHWRAFGPTSYSDHQLFGLVYEKLDELLDPMAERLTAFSQFDDVKFVNPLYQARYVYKRMKKVGPELEEALQSPDLSMTFFYRQLLALSRGMRDLSEDIKTEGYLTYGLDDALASAANEIEVLVYFLERRSQQLAPAFSPASLPHPEPSPIIPSSLSPLPPSLTSLPPALVLGPKV